MKKKTVRKSSFVIGGMLISFFLIACGDKKELPENLPEGSTAYADSEDIHLVGDGNYLDAYYVTEYRVNDVRVTKEEYDSTIEKYQYYTLY